MSGTAIGIDLGTSNSCVAVWKNGRVESIPNKLGEFVTPSWVSFKDREIIVGKTAKGNAYRNQINTICGIKRIIGRKFTDPVVSHVASTSRFKIIADDQGVPQIEIKLKSGVNYYYPENISALILSEMKNIAQAYVGDNKIVDAVITVPAYFNDHQRQATKDAAKIAGLNVLRLINEPTAAAIAYIVDQLEKDQQNVLVYDLGGGTFDVTVLSVLGGQIWVKATLGDTTLGGLNFDDRCIEYFLGVFHDKYDIDPEETLNPRFLRRLEEQIERAKHDLSSTVSTTLELLSACNGEDICEDFSRARFDDLNEELFLRTIQLAEQCIKEANLQNEDIDKIVLVGGSTRIPKIEELLESFFQKPLCKTINRDQAVAHGAAILAAHLNGTLNNILLDIKDVTPMALGIEILNNEINVIIPRNTQIPTEETCIYTTPSEEENAVRITILEGDNPYANQNLCLGTFDLLDLPINPIVEVTFKIDINGIVTVTAIESSSGTKKTVNVQLNKGRLTEKEIDRYHVECGKMFAESEKYQLVANLRNELESDLFKLEQTIKRSNTTNQEKATNLSIISELKRWMLSREAYVVEKLIAQKSYLSTLNVH